MNIEILTTWKEVKRRNTSIIKPNLDIKAVNGKAFTLEFGKPNKDGTIIAQLSD